MPARDPNIQKHTVNLRIGDVDYLQSLGATRGIPGSVLLRQIVSERVDQLRALERNAAGPIDLSEQT